MISNLQFDFNIDKPNNTVVIVKQFSANLSLVWNAFTNQEMLDKWWAPKPWKSRTSVMNFHVNGYRFYAMVSPEGQEHWSIQEFLSITPPTNFKMLNAFADATGNPELPGSLWDVHFAEQGGITTLQISITNESAERFEKLLAMGFQGGFTMTLTNLESLLAEINFRY
jgi:uncharacterized protein YndB with AHSA1/START domain